jgi:hypothetical protein
MAAETKGGRVSNWSNLDKGVNKAGHTFGLEEASGESDGGGDGEEACGDDGG